MNEQDGNSHSAMLCYKCIIWAEKYSKINLIMQSATNSMRFFAFICKCNMFLLQYSIMQFQQNISNENSKCEPHQMVI